MAVDDVYTKLLLHMDGTDNGSVFTDEAENTVIAVGNVCTKTDYKFTDVTAGKTYYASSINSATYNAAKAFDDNAATYWFPANSAANEWIAIDLGTGIVADILSILPTWYNSNAHCKDFTFYGSNDSTDGANGAWTSLASGQHANTNTTLTVKFNNTASYRWYKLVVNTSWRTDFIGGSIEELSIGVAVPITKFNSTCAKFDGVNSALTVSNSDFVFTVGTLDFWLYLKSYNSTYGSILFSSGTGASNGYCQYYNNVFGFYAPGSTLVGNFGAPSLNAWHHIALVADGSYVYCFTDGVQITKTAYTGNVLNNALLIIGAYSDAGFWLNGYIDELRVSKGIARWAENFTPPILPYTNKTYILSGTAELAPVALPVITAPPTTSAILWTADVPSGTSLSIKTAIGLTPPAEEDYIEVINGGQIPGLDISASEKFLYIKAYLATTDSSKTPKLISVSYFIDHAADKSTIQLNLADTGRLKYPIGGVLVAYNKALGSLTGLQGGQVQSFNVQFTPVPLTKIFNPNEAEKIEATLSVASSRMRIYYVDCKVDEYLQATLSAATQILAVADIPV